MVIKNKYHKLRLQEQSIEKLMQQRRLLSTGDSNLNVECNQQQYNEVNKDNKKKISKK